MCIRDSGNYVGSNLTVDAGRVASAGTGAIIGGVLGAVVGRPVQGAMVGGAIGGMSPQQQYYPTNAYPVQEYPHYNQYRESYHARPVYNVPYYEEQRQYQQPQYSDSCKMRYDANMNQVEQFGADTQNNAEYLRLKQRAQDSYANCVGRQ